jgi:superoxide dismutase
MKNKKALTYPFSLPILKFSLEELMPFLDAKTLDIHYNKHHAKDGAKILMQAMNALISISVPADETEQFF